MAANGIKLTPMRMGDLVSSTTQKVASKYLPPSKRSSSVQVVENIDMSDKNFPSLCHVPVKVIEKKESLSDKIKEKIRVDAITEELSANKEELDPWKMNDTELAVAGWVRLHLNSARDICINGFTNQGNPHIEEVE
jgi:hypothetical protein